VQQLVKNFQGLFIMVAMRDCMGIREGPGHPFTDSQSSARNVTFEAMHASIFWVDNIAIAITALAL
jgi:hypothetical protein